MFTDCEVIDLIFFYAAGCFSKVIKRFFWRSDFGHSGKFFSDSKTTLWHHNVQYIKIILKNGDNFNIEL